MNNTTTKKEIVIFRTVKELVNLIKNFAGYSMATMTTTTEPKCTKKSRSEKGIDGKPLLFCDIFKDTILKTSIRFVSIGNIYETAVLNRLQKEGVNVPEFNTEKPNGMHFYDNSKIILQKDTDENTFYLRYYYLNANSKKQVNTYHYETGELVPEHLINNLKVNFLPVSGGSKKQETAGLNIDNQITLNSIKVENIRRLQFGGILYILEGNETAEERQYIEECKKVYNTDIADNEEKKEKKTA